MKRLFYVFMALCLLISIAGADLVLHYEMDSADDFNLGEDVNGFTGRTYVTNTANGEFASGMTSDAGVFFDPVEESLRMESGWTQLIQGMEDGDALFTSATQYTFSMWAKGDKSVTTGNGYGFYLNFTDGSKFKCDLSWKPDAAAVFSSPGGGWQSSAYHIWDTDPQYADRYVNPESWNMYTFTWDADNQQIVTYVNGVLRGGPMASGTAITAGATVAQFGFGSESPYHKLGGWFKDYRVYDEVLDAAAVADLVGDFFLKARNPLPGSPSKFVTDANTADLTLSWKAGIYAASHDLYIGTDFNDVNDADVMSPVFEGNIANNSYNINLASGSTYYWRVDEVNDIDFWKGDVWNFTVIRVPDPVLLWEMDSEDDFTVGTGLPDGYSGRLYVDNKVSGYKYAGMTGTTGDQIHYDPDEGAVYMYGGTSCKIYGMVGNSIGEDPNLIFTSSTQYTFSLFAKGDMSAVSGNGYSFYLNFSDDSKFKCDLSWRSSIPAGPNNVPPAVNVSASFTSPGGGWQSSAYHMWDTIEPLATQYADRYVDPETWNMYTFVWDADNQFISTYVNGILRGGPMAAGTAITPGATVTDFGFGDVSGGSHGPGGWYKDYRVYDEALSADQIQFILGDFLLYPKAPSPKDNSTDVALEGTVLTWTHGLGAVSQDVYFGQSESAVENAGISSPEYKGQIAVDTFDPNTLELFKTYYWRVDQLDENSDLIVKGPVWNFSSIEYIMVEDFESYDNEGNDVTAIWTDKLALGDMQILLMNDPCLSPVNSMRLRHQVPYSPYYAIASRSFSPAQDWTVNGVRILTINYYGDAANLTLPLFVTIGDGTTDANVVITDVNTLVEGWQEINVSLLEIAAAGVDLNNVSYMEIGFGDGTNLGMSSSKWNILYIDNIALYPPKCVPSQSSLQADITEDCVVNYDDLDVFSDNWLLAGYTVSATAVSDDDLVLYYDFNGDAVDSVAGNDGTVQNLGSAATYEAGHDNQCIHFDATSGTSGSNMIIPEAALASLDDEVTFSFWLKKDEYSPQWYQALFAGHGVATGQCEIFKGYAPAEATNMQTTFSVGSDGCVAWQSWDSIPGLFDDDDPTIYTDWNHYAVVKNVKLGYIYLYINGELEQFISGKYKPVTGCDKFRLGSSASIENIDDYNFCKASFDEFKMYKRALTHAEILTLAGQSSATVPLSMFDGADDSDFNTDEAVDFKDYAILANEWLVEDLWP